MSERRGQLWGRSCVLEVPLGCWDVLMDPCAGIHWIQTVKTIVTRVHGHRASTCLGPLLWNESIGARAHRSEAQILQLAVVCNFRAL